MSDQGGIVQEAQVARAEFTAKDGLPAAGRPKDDRARASAFDSQIGRSGVRIVHERCQFAVNLPPGITLYTTEAVFAMLFSLIGSIVELPMTKTEEEILETLVTLEEAVAQMPKASPKPDLRPIFARLETLAGQLPKDTDRDLLHYLHRKSYQKARAHLEGR
jgi:hypothetical protein